MQPDSLSEIVDSVRNDVPMNDQTYELMIRSTSFFIVDSLHLLYHDRNIEFLLHHGIGIMVQLAILHLRYFGKPWLWSIFLW